MSIERKQVSARMSQSVRYGGVVYLAGQVAATADTVAGQTADILAQIDSLLAEAGTDKTRLLSGMIWLRDIGTFNEMNSVWDAWVPEGCAPARACVESRFPNSRVLVEIQVTAAAGS